MPITFKHNAAAVVPPSNTFTRKYGQSLVSQNNRNKQADMDRMFESNMQQQEQRSREFAAAKDRIGTYAQEMLKNPDLPPEIAKRIRDLTSAKTIAMGSGFNAVQQQEFLDQYNSQLAAILSEAPPPKPKPTRDEELKGFLGSAYDDPNIRKQPWVPDGNGGFVVADIPQPEQPKQTPKTFGEYWEMEPDKANKMLADKMAAIRLSMSDGEPLGPWKSVEDRALHELEQPFQIMQRRYGQQTQYPPTSAPAPATGASVGTGGNAWAPILDNGTARPANGNGSALVATIARPDGRTTYLNPDGTTYLGPMPTGDTSAGMLELSASPPGGGAMNIPDDNRRIPGVPLWRQSMPTEETLALDAQTQATMDSTNAQLAENQSVAAGVRAGYAPRTDAIKRQADAMSDKTDRAQAYLGGEMLPRAPQADPSGPYYRDEQGQPYDSRPSSMYDISDAKDKREADQFAKNKAEYDQYKTQRSAGDAKLTGRATNRIVDPKQLKRDSAKFSSDYQIYKRGGGELDIRDYIKQRAAQNSLPDDLKRQLQENYGLDLSSAGIQDVVEQDISGPRDQAMADAKAKRDTEDARRQAARANINASRGYRGATTTPSRKSAPKDTTRPKRGLPGGPPTAPEQTYEPGPWKSKYQFPAQQALPQAAPSQPSSPYLSDEEATDINNRFAQRDAAGAPKSLPMPAQSGLPQAPEPNFGTLFANVKDDTERAVLGAIQQTWANAKSPEIKNALGVLVGPGKKAEKLAAFRYLQASGVDVEQMYKAAVGKQAADGNAYTESAYSM